jgi:hypothetical protein
VSHGEASLQPLASRSVTFSRPFLLPGMDVPHQPGTFEIREIREELDAMHGAYRITHRVIVVDGGKTEVFEVTSEELEFALALDEVSIRNPG